MYITNTTDNVKKLFEKIDNLEEKSKLEYLIYVFDSVYNHHINSKNSVNPDLDEDDIEIFDFESIGLSNAMCSDFIEYLLSIYSKEENKSYLYDDGNIHGIEYENINNNIISDFEKLSFNEKLDVIAELLIEYDNRAYFNYNCVFEFYQSGFDIAREVQEYKNNV